MLKPTHKRPRAGEPPVRGWVGVPSHVLGFLLAQRLARPGFTDCLCLSLLLSLVAEREHDNRQGEQQVYTVTGAHAEADAQETTGGRGCSTGLGWRTQSCTWLPSRSTFRPPRICGLPLSEPPA